jgi:hypothetical protein
MAASCLASAVKSPEKRLQLMRRAKVWLMLAQDSERTTSESIMTKPEKRPGPFAQDPSRRPE